MHSVVTPAPGSAPKLSSLRTAGWQPPCFPDVASEQPVVPAGGACPWLLYGRGAAGDPQVRLWQLLLCRLALRNCTGTSGSRPAGRTPCTHKAAWSLLPPVPITGTSPSLPLRKQADGAGAPGSRLRGGGAAARSRAEQGGNPPAPGPVELCATNGVAGGPVPARRPRAHHTGP